MPRICILMYHMVVTARSAQERRYAVSAQRFASHMKALRSKGFSVVSLAEVQEHLLHRGKIAERAVAVTFDDGYADNYENAFPILQEFEIPATVFVVVNEVGGENRWMSRSKYVCRRMLDWGQVHEMQAAGIGFGSHTLTHPHLTEVSVETARVEIQRAKRVLEDQLGASVDHFAYPYGDMNEQIVELVGEAGHTLACSTRSGFNRTDVDPLRLRRIDVYGTDSTFRLLQKVNLGSNSGRLQETVKYYLKRAAARLSIG